MKSKNNIQFFPYLERDISWMYFNHRILLEAQKQSNPLLERVNFLGIYSNNLDEFFRVRVALLNRLLECPDKTLKKDKNNILHTLKEINRLNDQFSEIFEKEFIHLLGELKKENIHVINEEELNNSQKEYIFSFYKSKLSSSTIPLFLTSQKTLVNETDSNIYLAIRLTKWNKQRKKEEKEFAIIELPVQEFGRFICLPSVGRKKSLIFLDDIVRFCLPLIFVGMDYSHYEAYSFKFTRDAAMELDPDLRSSVVQKIGKGVKSRKKGEPIRFVHDDRMPKDLVKQLTEKLSLKKNDVRVAGGRYHNLKDLMSFPDCTRKDLKYIPQPPLLKPELTKRESILHQIRRKDRFLHFPYHNFDYYIRVLREAAISKEVRSIKTTVYRLADDSKIVKALIGAAKNGKKVTVVVELLARFDEASNINWAKKMEDAGIQVIFGVEGLKIHSKITHITTIYGNIACISTGNFHEGNARAYTDYMLMTANRPIVKEIEDVFKFIEKPYLLFTFKKLLVSPNGMRKKLIQLINKEIKNKESGKPAYILTKLNHVTDKEIIEKLYEASKVGVNITMIIRGNCSIKTNVHEISENIHIKCIIDRYLEHSRLFIFANGGDEQYYMGSADWMTRNLDYRVEVLTPVYDKDIQADIKQVIEFGLWDNVQSYIVDGTGENKRWTNDSPIAFRSQEEIYNYYKQSIELELQKEEEPTLSLQPKPLPQEPSHK